MIYGSWFPSGHAHQSASVHTHISTVTKQKHTHTHNTQKMKLKYSKGLKVKYIYTFWPLSINLTAKSSLVKISLTSFATAKFPEPISLTTS